MDVEEKAIITQEFQDITNNDMHVIEAIGMGTPKNMSSIAKELSVTEQDLFLILVKFIQDRGDHFFMESRMVDKRFLSLIRKRDIYDPAVFLPAFPLHIPFFHRKSGKPEKIGCVVNWNRL